MVGILLETHPRWVICPPSGESELNAPGMPECAIEVAGRFCDFYPAVTGGDLGELPPA